MSNLEETLTAARVLPVVTPVEVEQTVLLAQSLVAGGMTAIEVTLRSETALDCVREIRQALPQLTVAVGTILNPADLEAAAQAGAHFCVSPGISAPLLEAAASGGIDFLPGVATASDILLGLSHDVSIFKLFPAAAVGGMPLLKSFAGPFAQVRFCPTGGLDVANFREYLALPNVLCCGGSWMVTREMVRAGDWQQIETLARDAMQVDH